MPVPLKAESVTDVGAPGGAIYSTDDEIKDVVEPPALTAVTVAA